MSDGFVGLHFYVLVRILDPIGRNKPQRSSLSSNDML